ncbi:hypothetical protein JQC92_15050 [Shewanella sp. 202IG2-18]|uniref:hypothetical protein n=1 Tax=Parashewanella hymeniacidonis TaxID=2807618 RepID=UPI0019605444|nr:hypothetical protein [Parashewanella hymeniacidonis]MBM7073331.1 hypothetical protein [Parashewanella hymeniacidonis]
MAEAGIPKHVSHHNHVALSKTTWTQDQDKKTATFNIRIDGYFAQKSSATYDVRSQEFSLVVKSFLGSVSQARHFEMKPSLNDPTSVMCNKLVLHYAPISILKAEILKNPSDLLLILDELSSERAYDLFTSLLDVQALMALHFLAKVTSKSVQVSSHGKMTPLSELISKTMLNVLPQYKGGAFYYKLLLTEQAYPGGKVLFDTREYE